MVGTFKSNPFVLGLTGSIGMGKSTVAGMMRDMGIPVFDADRYVRRLLNKGGAGVVPVRAAFSKVYNKTGQKIDRKILRQIVLDDPMALHTLERILHPLVRAAEIRFIRRCQKRGRRLIVLDVPLLYQTGADALCTAVMVVSAPPDVQRARVLARRGMTPTIFKAILKRQSKAARAYKRADYILNTGQTITKTKRDLQAIIRAVKQIHA
jgi:dephospho-CoA kinase